MATRRLIFQLGTNNWQRGGEFAPGSGILHEAHHKAFNALPDVRAYSIYPSKVQRLKEEDVRVFELDHDIPICESISPVSSYRWHGMSDSEIAAYRARLTATVEAWMDEIEARENATFNLAIAHHTFLNPLVMRDVIRNRIAAGRPKMPLLCFAHGTALKMYANERRGDRPGEFPPRFLPFMEREKIFAYDDPDHGVDLCAAISTQQIDALVDIFPRFPRDRVVLSPNGYNQDVFQIRTAPVDLYGNRQKVLQSFTTVPYEGSDRPAEPVRIDGGINAVVAFCGKFADWKRLDVLLRAARLYEADGFGIATLVIGSGPHEAQVQMQDLAFNELKLRHTFFLGPRGQDELATLFNTADIGCFPSKNEPFGLVFIECMACGTPVIGVNSGGPRDFVTPKVGVLVPESDDKEVLAQALADAVRQALVERWKLSKGAVAAAFARNNYSVVTQVENLLSEVDRLC